MGVESDRLVFDYLSRVGDLAQALPAAQRMQLVARLRQDIERERGGADNPAAVRRILGRFGSPDAVVEAAGGGSPGSAGEGSAAGPGAYGSAGAPGPEEPGVYGPYAKRGGGAAPAEGETAGDTGRDDAQVPGPRRRDRDEDPDWWSVTAGGGLRAGDELTGLPGMTGGVFIPVDDEDLDSDGFPSRDRSRSRPPGPAAGAEEGAGGPPAEAVPEPEPKRARRRRLLPSLRGGARGWGSPTLLIAAALLVAGAVAGSLIPLGLGWLTAYLTRALSRPQAKFAVLGIPGTAGAGLIAWVWGRDAGRWGAPIAEGQVGQAFQDAYPVTIRVAAVGTALYCLWRSRRSAARVA